MPVANSRTNKERKSEHSQKGGTERKQDTFGNFNFDKLKKAHQPN